MDVPATDNKDLITITSVENHLHKLVAVKSLENLYMSGYGRIAVFKGRVILNGHQLSKHVSYRFSNPHWLPALDITVKSVPSSSSRPSIQSILRKSGMENDYPSAISLLPDIDDCTILLIQGLSWDDNDLEWLEAADNSSIFSSQSQSFDIHVSSIINCGSCYLFDDKARLSSSSLKSLIIPSDWNLACDHLVRSMTEQHVKVPVCGAKGSGKSTLMKYTCNRLLNHYKKVCIIDCDLGQPEFTVSGIISLSVIDQPLFAPSFMNINRKPLLSYFIGDITTKNNPDYLFACVRLLYARYVSYVAEENQMIEQEQAASRKMNPFEALNDNSPRTKLPLLINCDGNIRFFGEEVLSEIFSIIQPTDIVHIVTPKDPQLRPVDYQASTNSCSVIKVAPGQVIPSTIHAADLRTLRIISYFLRDRIALKEFTKPYHDLHDYDADSPEKSSEGVISISNGAVNDLHGNLAAEILRIAPYVMPFQSISLRFTCDAITPRLTLAGFNGAIVGITERHSSSSVPFSMIHKFRRSSNDEFLLNIGAVGAHDDHIRPCIGVGIVRAISISEQVLYLMSSSLCEMPGEVQLLRGSVALPMSLCYVPDLPIHPYITAETHGEGSNEIKPRTNVKRKYQHDSSS